MQFLRFATKEDFSDGYNTLRWTKFTDFAESAVTTGTTSTDGVTPADTAIALTTLTVSPTQYRIVVSLSDMLLKTNPLPLLQKTGERVGYVMAKKMDSVIQTAIMAGTEVFYAGTGNSARNDLEATDVLTLDHLNKAASVLSSRDVEPFDDGYVAIMHPSAIYDLRSVTGAGSWQDISKYSQTSRIYSGELGMIFGVRIVQSSHVNTFTNASSVVVYPTLVIGRDAYGVGFVQQPQVFITPAGPSDSDPAAQRRKVAAKAAFGTVILEENAMVRIESGGTSLAI
jgi:N4-gp56 family major capsid protein